VSEGVCSLDSNGEVVGGGETRGVVREGFFWGEGEERETCLSCKVRMCTRRGTGFSSDEHFDCCS
jgi:hypothetical protein